MTIAVACNLADGVVIGTDSATTITGAVTTPAGQQEGVLKVYNDAEKLFQLFDLPVCIATYGVAQLNLRTIESFIREFEHTSNEEELKESSLQDVSTQLWKFFREKYTAAFQASLEQRFGVDLDQIDIRNRPVLGLVIGGFSPKEYLSELWDVHVHSQSESEGVIQTRAPGNFGSSWRGQIEGIRRFHKGFSFEHLDRVIHTILQHYSVPMDETLKKEIEAVVASAEYVIPWGGMPLQEGIDYVTFCLDTMINQTKFVIGAPTCGGSTRVGIVHRDKGFQIISNTEFQVRR